MNELKSDGTSRLEAQIVNMNKKISMFFTRDGSGKDKLLTCSYCRLLGHEKSTGAYAYGGEPQGEEVNFEEVLTRKC